MAKRRQSLRGMTGEHLKYRSSSGHRAASAVRLSEGPYARSGNYLHSQPMIVQFGNCR